MLRDGCGQRQHEVAPLPEASAGQCADDLILSCALYYSAQAKAHGGRLRIVLLSGDKLLSIKMAAHGVQCCNTRQLCQPYPLATSPVVAPQQSSTSIGTAAAPLLGSIPFVAVIDANTLMDQNELVSLSGLATAVPCFTVVVPFATLTILDALKSSKDESGERCRHAVSWLQRHQSVRWLQVQRTDEVSKMAAARGRRRTSASIFECCKYYQQQQQQQCQRSRVVLISKDQATLARAQREGQLCCSAALLVSRGPSCL